MLSMLYMNQLKSDSHDFKEMNEKLSEEIKTLKKRKEQACEEKLVLKAEKAKMEQWVESMTNNLPPPAFHAAAIKMPFFLGYGYIPMCQYLPQSTCDRSLDHELRPLAS
ncbi:hypothetical protein HanXRQr2_Chr13g0612691 [Helianthus annuus]|uniref:Uncharacterized protein n=1 Tax=Helianthus annuus TaxID=4232 RepID=A0A9K3HCP0_HELAN|nr:hypothetical protein HanXRQr2_Chr13g0612691 [Helianthus annuus]KAJ0483444.1 hypothetical protein HanIR_Chr13g0664861 [Helianthus annuus]KAJ0851242.1 hypothetical protein HanPSC8_Chr13g0589961 [Helianthus annuus]